MSTQAQNIVLIKINLVASKVVHMEKKYLYFT